MNASEWAVIWDMDGTLVDTAEFHFQAWTVLMKELKQPFTRADFDATFGWRNPEILRQLYGGRYSDKEIEAIGARKEELYRSAARAGVVLLPGARGLLESLKSGGFRQAIGSSAPRANLELILTLTSTVSVFDAVVSMEDVQRGKPDPQVFQIAAERLGVAPAHCLVIEDAVAGVQAAKAGDMKCIAVRFAGHHSEDSLRRAGADLVVKNLEQVTVDTVREILVVPRAGK
jgi:beta-phosphoglucomutase